MSPLGRSVALHSLGEILRTSPSSSNLNRIEILSLISEHLRQEGGALGLAAQMVDLELSAMERSRAEKSAAESPLRTLLDSAVSASEGLYMAAARNDKAPRGLPSKEDKARGELEVCLRGLHLAHGELKNYAHPNIWEEAQDGKSFEIDEARITIQNPCFSLSHTLRRTLSRKKERNSASGVR